MAEQANNTVKTSKPSPMQLAGEIARRLEQNPNIGTAIRAAILVSSEEIKAQDVAVVKGASAWAAWLNVAREFADSQFTPDLAKMAMEYLSGVDELSVESLKVYRSIVANFVPILQLGDKEYNQLWTDAGIDAPVSRTPNNQFARRLIRQFTKGDTEQSQLRTELATVNKALVQATAVTNDGKPKDANAFKRAQMLAEFDSRVLSLTPQQAMEALEICLGMLPEKQGDETVHAQGEATSQPSQVREARAA